MASIFERVKQSARIEEFWKKGIIRCLSMILKWDMEETHLEGKGSFIVGL